jgi:hypothetical protein
MLVVIARVGVKLVDRWIIVPTRPDPTRPDPTRPARGPHRAAG